MATADAITEKACTLCKLVKPLSDFHISRKERDGHVSRCKRCWSEQQKRKRAENPEAIREREFRSHNRPGAKEAKRQYRIDNRDAILAKKKADYQANREKILASQATYRAANPELRKAADRLLYERKKQDYIERACRWKKANPEKVKESHKWYHAKNPEMAARLKHQRRAREMAAHGEFTADQVRELRKKQRNKCACCRAKLLKMHVDHIVPLSKGGTNDILNIQLLCPPCNLSKGAKDPVDFMQLNGFLI